MDAPNVNYKKGLCEKKLRTTVLNISIEVRCACDPFYLQVSLRCSSDPMLIIDHLGPIFLLVRL